MENKIAIKFRVTIDRKNVNSIGNLMFVHYPQLK